MQGTNFTTCRYSSPVPCPLASKTVMVLQKKIHTKERIVSISQPWLRPIVRGKAKAPVEFGAKFDLSLDSEGYGRIEKISFEASNESTCLIEATERFRERTDYYPERVLADQIYRIRKNRSIRIIPIESKWSAPSA